MTTTPKLTAPVGPPNARILVVGEAFGADEALRGVPFVGAAGRELTKILHEAGVARSDCLITNVVNARPPANNIKAWFTKHTATTRIPGPILAEGMKALRETIERVKPDLIIALGETALWALTGATGIMNWRGSQMRYDSPGHSCKLVPTVHPAAILRQWSWRMLAVHDIKRAREWLEGQHEMPAYEFTINPSYQQAVDHLHALLSDADAAPLQLSFDVETRPDLQITCFGIANSAASAICIPLTSVSGDHSYWAEHEEVEILWLLKQLFSHPNISWLLQNAAYDFQWTARLWGMIPRNLGLDTMLAHHVLWNQLPKSLDFQSSLYCDYHCFWKNEGADFHKSLKTHEDELTYWRYNCKDACTTWEIAQVLRGLLEKEGLQEPNAFQHRQFHVVLRMMLRGVRVNTQLKDQLRMELFEARAARERWLEEVIGYPLNVRSPKQMKDFFYSSLGLAPVYNRKTGKLSTDSKSLEKLSKREILIRPIVEVIEEIRSLGVFLGTFINASLDHDKRMRCSYNLAGTETYRYSSSSDAFGFGTNLQNIPKGDE